MADLFLSAIMHGKVKKFNFSFYLFRYFKDNCFKVFRYSFSEAIPIFFNRLKSIFFRVRSL